MKELKSKKTGMVSICTEEEYAAMVNKKPDWLKRFDVTDLKSFKQAVSPIKETPVEIKTKKAKNEG